MKSIPVILLLFIIPLIQCTVNNSNGEVPDNICRQDPCYPGPFDPPWLSAYDEGLVYRDEVGIELTCDNKVLETPNVLTFSDSSGDEIKMLYAEMTETALAEIKILFQIPSSAALGIIDRDTKITIYSNRDGFHRQNSKAFGFILNAIDRRERANPEDPEFLAWYRRQVKHETTHVVEYFITGKRGLTYEWFNEGLAEHVSGGVLSPITSWEEVEEWLENPDHTNPITINQIFPVPWNRVGEFYPIFRLAVEYLLDSRGLGKTIIDVKAILQDIGDHTSDFPEAFETHIGISLEYYADHFYQWMEEYLKPARIRVRGGG